MDIRRHTRRWKSFLAAGLATALTGAVAASVPSASANTEKVAIYFAVCDGNTASDTVKIKKIYEDGTGITTIGDTTIANCGPGGERYFSGLATTTEYSYFSWFQMNGSAAGIGRIKNDGSGTMDMNYMTLPATPLIGWFQMSPKVLNGQIFVNVRNLAEPEAHRILRGTLSTGTLETCHQPADLGLGGLLSIGVGRDAVYFAAYKPGDATTATKIYKTDCNTTSLATDFGVASGDAMFHRALVGPFDWDNDGNANNNYTLATSNLVAESETASYVYTIKAQAGNKDSVGISSMNSMALNGFNGHGTASGGSDFGGFTDSQVWGFNYLYYKDGAATKMYRVKPGGTPEQVFADHIKGTLHHMSVIKETPTTPSTTAPTKVPLVITKKGVTGKQIAADLGLPVTKGSKIRLSVAKKSRKVCAVKKTRVVSSKKGKTCRVTITITPKKGKSIKRTTSFTTS